MWCVMTWAVKFSCCVVCNSDAHKHMANGKCSSCYQLQYRAENAEAIKLGKRSWADRNLKRHLANLKRNREQNHFDGNRDLVIRRDKHECVRCGSRQKLTVHHKDRNGRGRDVPNNALSNLETLCRACHLNEHRAEIRQGINSKRTPQLLRSGKWSLKRDSCRMCKLNTSKHASKGVCAACYQKKLREAAR